MDKQTDKDQLRASIIQIDQGQKLTQEEERKNWFSMNQSAIRNICSSIQISHIEDIIYDKINLFIIGETSSGKSTTINHLLSLPKQNQTVTVYHICQTDKGAKTKFISKFMGHEQDIYAITVTDVQSKKILEFSSFSDIVTFMQVFHSMQTGYFEEKKDVEFRVELPFEKHPFLKLNNGQITIIDTPSLNSAEMLQIHKGKLIAQKLFDQSIVLPVLIHSLGADVLKQTVLQLLQKFSDSMKTRFSGSKAELNVLDIVTKGKQYIDGIIKDFQDQQDQQNVKEQAPVKKEEELKKHKDFMRQLPNFNLNFIQYDTRLKLYGLKDTILYQKNIEKEIQVKGIAVLKQRIQKFTEQSKSSYALLKMKDKKFIEQVSNNFTVCMKNIDQLKASSLNQLPNYKDFTNNFFQNIILKIDCSRFSEIQEQIFSVIKSNIIDYIKEMVKPILNRLVFDLIDMYKFISTEYLDQIYIQLQASIDKIYQKNFSGPTRFKNFFVDLFRIKSPNVEDFIKVCQKYQDDLYYLLKTVYEFIDTIFELTLSNVVKLFSEARYQFKMGQQ